MRTWALASAIVISVFALSVSSFAQAAAEGALTHAISSGMGSAIGENLGRATNQLSGKVAQQVSNTAPRQKSVSVKNLPPHAVAPATAHAEASSGGSLIVSIQGGATDSMSCAEATKTTPRVADAANLDPSKKNQTAQGQSTKPAQNGCGPIASHDAESHPSVVNLTAGK